MPPDFDSVIFEEDPFNSEILEEPDFSSEIFEEDPFTVEILEDC